MQQNIHKFLLACLLMLGFTLPLPNTPQGLSALAELGAAFSVGSTQIGEQKAPQVQANLLAAVPLLKRLFGKQSNKVATKPTEPSPQPEWFNSMAAGMKFTIYDENGTAQYSQTVNVGSIPPEDWGKLRQTYTAPISGLLEVEIFNYNFNFPVYFDDWHIQLTENSRPEIVQEVHYDPWGLVMQDESYFAPASPAENSGLFNGKELQTLADLHLYDYHWRQYDPQLGRWHNVDAMADKFHGLSPYNYCLNNPVMITDPDGREPITAAILIGAAIGALIGGGSYAVMTPSNQWNLGGFLKSVAIGAVSGAVSGGVTAGLGAIAPSFASWGLIGKYAGKALYAGFTGMTSSTAGMLTSDFLQDGSINNSWASYRDGALLGGGIAMGISIGYSIHDYVTWDRFSFDQRIDIVNQKFSDDPNFNNARYDATLDNLKDAKGNRIISYGETEMTEMLESGNKYYDVRLSKLGLSSRTTAFSVMKHELKHVQLWENGLYRTPPDGGNRHEYFAFTDQMDYFGKSNITYRTARFVTRQVQTLENNLGIGTNFNYFRKIKFNQLWYNLFR
jgi:RHS repeat-associated protein